MNVLIWPKLLLITVLHVIWHARAMGDLWACNISILKFTRYTCIPFVDSFHTSVSMFKLLVYNNYYTFWIALSQIRERERERETRSNRWLYYYIIDRQLLNFLAHKSFLSFSREFKLPASRNKVQHISVFSFSVKLPDMFACYYKWYLCISNRMTCYLQWYVRIKRFMRNATQNISH